ncbi:hypothetical protein [Phenylobacterium sp.]|jgi:hypothetical protein|uniref:hypothetical protein n=1 Tax=Phenylobacterium sp. TaxID=1871053 RepID=UPI002F93C6A1
MRDAADEWWVIASAAATLHGADQPEPADVDVLASERDATSVLEALGIKPEGDGLHPLFRSRVIGRWTSPPMPVEIMAGFNLLTDTGWREVALKTRESVRVGAEVVFVPSREELVGLLTAIGRPKDLVRAHQLRAR